MVIINGLAAILFMIGYILFGTAMIRTATLPRWSGVLVAVGAPAHLLGFGIVQLVTIGAGRSRSSAVQVLAPGSAGRLPALAETDRFGCGWF